MSRKEAQVRVALTIIVAAGVILLGVWAGSALNAPSTPRAPRAVATSRATPAHCPTGYYSVSEDAELWVTKNMDDNRYYHIIPEGDPIGATGKCNYYFTQAMHGGDTGWVFRHQID